MRRRDVALPCDPIGMDRLEASAYVCVSTTLFDQMVSDGRMPSPKVVGSRKIWDREELRRAFKALPSKDERNDWDDESDDPHETRAH